ncbi:MAG TPA: IS66 family insertion sequence element accessory protein TnpB [Verrucomicrobiae bacterium]|jgi:transposase|nr:IS66 family insertion sequence element accessory protein TnpB [Verrucomicrobiae bacterium]
MIPLSPATRIYLASGATDLRKSFEGLSDLVTHHLLQEPLNGCLYVFINRRKNRIKLFYFDGSGVWVCAKRLMGPGCFAWPRTEDPGALQIVAEELTLLLTGIDLEKTSARPWWRKAG